MTAEILPADIVLLIRAGAMGAHAGTELAARYGRLAPQEWLSGQSYGQRTLRTLLFDLGTSEWEVSKADAEEIGRVYCERAEDSYWETLDAFGAA